MASKFERMMEFTPIWANDFAFKNKIELFQVMIQKKTFQWYLDIK